MLSPIEGGALKQECFPVRLIRLLFSISHHFFLYAWEWARCVGAGWILLYEPSPCVGFSHFWIKTGLRLSSNSLIVTSSIIPFPFLSFSVSRSLCPSLKCCLAVGLSGRIIILKLKRAVWTQDWGMNCLVELAAVTAAARTELSASSPSHPHLGT